MLLYNYVPDIAIKRPAYRPAHLSLAQEWVASKKLLLGGAWQDLGGAALLFHTHDRAEVQQFAWNDPYVKNGLVTNWVIKEWNVVVRGIQCD
jgi:uncharacterized protein YciI